jgi:chromosomal replication initiation ATPase DnaA
MIDLARLVARAAALFDVSDGALLDGRGRSSRLVAARQALAYILHERQYTVVEIGVMLRRDHSTICYALKQARRRLLTDPAYATQVAALMLDEPTAPTVAQTVAGRITPITPGLRISLTFWGVLAPRSA